MEDGIMKYFTKEEVIRCYRERKEDRCKECRLTQAVKKLPNGIEENMEALVTEVLEPVCEKLGNEIVVLSGFRCPLENRRQGGSNDSPAVKGEAVEIAPVQDSGFTVLDLARVIEELGKYDELIVYPTYVRVSYKRQGGNRKEVKR